MIRQSEFKPRFDPELGRYAMKHIHDKSIYGEGIMDVFRSVGSKLFGITAKELAKKRAKTAAKKAVTKTGELAGNKAGDKIIQLLSKKQPSKSKSATMSKPNMEQPLTDFQIAERVNQMISGGKLKRRRK